MAKKKRFEDYAPKTQAFILKHGMTPTEYRLKRGIELGRTDKQSRGRDKVARPDLSPSFERAIKQIKKGSTIDKAAKNQGVSPSSLKKYMKEQGITTKRGSVIKETKRGESRVSQMMIDNDPRARSWFTISGGNKVPIRVDAINASINGYYLNDVQSYISGKMSHADFKRRWEGVTITTIDGQVIPLDTTPIALRRANRQPSPNPYAIES